MATWICWRLKGQSGVIRTRNIYICSKVYLTMQSFFVACCYFGHQDVKHAQICSSESLITHKMFLCFLGDTIMAGRSVSGFLCFFLIKKWKNITLGQLSLSPPAFLLIPSNQNILTICSLFLIAVPCPCCIFLGYFIKHILKLSLHLLVSFLPYLEAYTAFLVVLPPAVPTLLAFLYFFGVLHQTSLAGLLY